MWCTRKAGGLEGRKLLLVELWDAGTGTFQEGPCQVCADVIGAGAGERVLLVRGSAARYAVGDPAAPVDRAVVGIVDGWEMTP